MQLSRVDGVRQVGQAAVRGATPLGKNSYKGRPRRARRVRAARREVKEPSCLQTYLPTGTLIDSGRCGGSRSGERAWRMPQAAPQLAETRNLCFGRRATAAPLSTGACRPVRRTRRCLIHATPVATVGRLPAPVLRMIAHRRSGLPPSPTGRRFYGLKSTRSQNRRWAAVCARKKRRPDSTAPQRWAYPRRGVTAVKLRSKTGAPPARRRPGAWRLPAAAHRPDYDLRDQAGSKVAIFRRARPAGRKRDGLRKGGA